MTAEQFLQLTIVLPEPCLLVSGRGQILAVNPPAAELIGRSTDQLIGAALADFASDTQEKLLDYLQSCSRSRAMIMGSLTLRTGGREESPFRCEGAVVKPWSKRSSALIFLRLKTKQSASTSFLLLNNKIDALGREIRERKRVEREREEMFVREQATRAEAEQAHKLMARALAREQAARASAQEAVAEHRLIQERLTHLVDASAVLLSSLQVEAILPVIVDIAKQVVAADGYSVWRYKAHSGLWQLMAGVGLSEEYIQQTGTVLAGTTPAPIQPIVAEDAASDERLRSRLEAYKAEGIKSVLIVPLHIHGQSSGTIGFYYRQTYRFEETEVRVATALANLAAAAIGTAELYEEQTRLREQSEIASRSKDEFLAMVSHELRTPLNAIIGWTSMLRTGRLEEQTARRAVETIERNAKSQAKLIEDLLDISRIITGKLRLNIQPVDLSSVVEAAVDIIRPAAAAKEVRLQVVLDSAGLVSGDPERLQQVVWNLLSNAVKFTPKKGRVHVRLQRVNSHLEIIVSDTGQGIKPEFLPYVFDRFRQADSSISRMHGGLGLGLAIVRNLVDLHGGEVSAYSNGEGQGATFAVKFPLMIVHQPAPHQIASRQGQEKSVAAGHPIEGARLLAGMRLLIAEDEPDARELLKMMLEQFGAEVKATSSAKEAFQELEDWKPDLMISDIEMPGEDGYSLIQRIRSAETRPGRVPAIALTAHARAEDRMRALRSGYDAHVAKPVEANELVTVIESLARTVGKI